MIESEKDVDSLLKSNQKEKLKKELLTMKENFETSEEHRTHEKSQQEDVGELSMYDNHPADMGTELFERERDIALSSHAESELTKVNEALERIKTDTYGICEICGKSIQYERLEIVPYTTLCIEHAKMKQSINDEDISSLDPNTFDETKDGRARDFQNSFDEVAEFGTSDSPQDFTDSENPSYTDGSDDEAQEVDELVGRSVTDDTDN